MNNMNVDHVNRFILYKQHLTDDTRIDDICQIVRDILGLHAQVPTTPYLSLFVRAMNFTKEQLETKLYVQKTLAKIKCLRQTIFILPKELIPPTFIATKRFFKVSSDRYPKYLGITEQEYKKISKTIEKTVYDHGLTTKEIKKNLKSSENISLIVNHMCDQGLLIRGKPQAGWKSNIHTYHSFARYLPDVDIHALDELSSRIFIIEEYIKSFGPVCANDIEWWTGFPKGETKKILEDLKDQIVNIDISGIDQNYLISKSDEEKIEVFLPPKEPIINLLPVLDPYIMGFRERQRYIDNRDYDNVFDFNGNATSTILLDGRVIGIWDIPKKKEPVIKILLFSNKLNENTLEKVFSKAKAIGKFITDSEVEIQQCDSIIPLTQRTAGGYLSPLKDFSEIEKMHK